MATSSFTQNFKVTKRQSDAFIKIMTEAVPPTLSREFKSRIINPLDNTIKEKIERAFMK